MQNSQPFFSLTDSCYETNSLQPCPKRCEKSLHGKIFFSELARSPGFSQRVRSREVENLLFDTSQPMMADRWRLALNLQLPFAGIGILRAIRHLLPMQVACTWESS